MIAAVASFAQAATGGGARPVEVRFEHAAPPDVAEHRRVFGCPIRFRARATGLSWPFAALGLALAGTDPKLGALIRVQPRACSPSVARARRWPRRCARQCVEGWKRRRAPGLAAASGRGRSRRRTLQRRLRDQSMSWPSSSTGSASSCQRAARRSPARHLANRVRAGFQPGERLPPRLRRIAGTTPRRYRLELAAAEDGGDAVACQRCHRFAT